MRIDYTQLPAVQELKEILEKEAWRNPAAGKENTHYPDFTTVINWLSLLNEPQDLFTGDKTWEEIIVRGTEIEERVVRKTLSGAEKGRLDLEKTAGKVTEYLGGEDVPEEADMIFVFGSKSNTRIQKAVDLWREGLAPKIFITGGSPHYKEGEEPEALVFKQYALTRGVPEGAIIVEPQAITIADNVRRSINLFEEKGIAYRRMIMVTAWFAMRRSWAFMMKYIPGEYKLFRAGTPVKTGGDFDPNLWWKNENGIRVVFNEYVKMRTGVALNTC